MFSRIPSLIMLALTLLVGAQLAVAQVHCGLLTTADDHDCALCHTANLQFVEDDSAAAEPAQPPSGRVFLEPATQPDAPPSTARCGRAPPSLS